MLGAGGRQRDAPHAPPSAAAGRAANIGQGVTMQGARKPTGCAPYRFSRRARLALTFALGLGMAGPAQFANDAVAAVNSAPRQITGSSSPCGANGRGGFSGPSSL